MTKIKIQSKMEVLNLNGQGLLVLLFFLFMACDQLLPPPAGGTGKRVEPIIRSVRVRDYIDYGETSGTRSADGESRIVSQPIIQDLGGGLVAEITIGEDLSALRDDEPVYKTLDDNVRFRVIAVTKSTNKIYSYADYESNGQEQSYDLINNTKLHVLDGVDYDYIFISYNSTTLPPAPKEGDAIGSITVDAGSHDLMWKTINSSQTTDSDGVPDLNFGDLTHKLAKIKVLKFKSNETFTNVVSGSISLNAGNSGSFNLKEGEFSSSSGNTVFSGWTGSGNQEVACDEITFLPKKNCTLTIPKNTFTLGNQSLPTANIAVGSDKFKFLVGGRYTVTITLKEASTSNKFAGSNIFWDGSKLTFVAHGGGSGGGVDSTKFQGVYFKWGSLIGISPAQTSGSTTFSSGTTANSGQNDGTPIYLKDPDGNWVKTNVTYATATDPKWLDWWRAVPASTTDSAAWNAIPSYYGTSITESALVGDNAYSLLANPDFEHYKGDICNYINPAYRMPTRNELIALYNSDASKYYTKFTSSSITNQTADGKTAFTAQFGTFTGLVDATNSTYYLPASGYRYNSSGTLHTVGDNGYYWSGSALSGTSYAYELYFNSSGNANTNNSSRSYGQPVRCVLQE